MFKRTFKELLSPEFWRPLIEHPAFFLILVVCLLAYAVSYLLTKETLGAVLGR